MAVHSFDDLFIATQRLLPQHGLSRLLALLAEAKTPWLKNALIRHFASLYGINMLEAEKEHPADYDCFNDFFTRALKVDARPVEESADTVVSPVDGTISQIGNIEGAELIQAKGRHFTLFELLGGDADYARQFENGRFTTIYLSPSDYHRVHMPIAGDLVSASYIPGKLFSVNEQTAQNVPGLFARNERLVCRFDTLAGPCALIMVGAMLVAGIETVWSGGLIQPNTIANFTPAQRPYTLQKGAEMGRFCFGSTVILLFERDRIEWQKQLAPQAKTLMGTSIAQVLG